MIDVLISEVTRLCKVTKDKWIIELRQGGGGFLRNQNAPSLDRYFSDIDECFSQIDQECKRFEK